MKKGIILPVEERDLDDKNGKHVIIERDEDPLCPYRDWDQAFLFHSNIPREFCGNETDKNYEDPLEEIVDEDGFATGEYRFKDGIVVFPISAYIHGGISLTLGTCRCMFGDTPSPSGRGWDTTPNAAYLWTDKERYEKMCAPWMTVWDEELKKSRPAKDEKEFMDHLRDLAQGELKEIQDYFDGRVWGFRTEVAFPYTKTYADGRVEEGADWEDGEESCWGFYLGEGDNPGDIDFPKGDGWKVFDATGCFGHDEYDICEYVIVSYCQPGHAGKRMFLKEYKRGGDDDRVISSLWTPDLEEAEIFEGYCPSALARDLIPKELYDCEKNCVEIDTLRKEQA